MASRLLITGLLHALLISTYATVFLEVDWILYLGVEDALFEILGALGFLTASCLFAAVYIKSKDSLPPGEASPKLKRNAFFLFLAVIFFIGFGEEISWGQRILGWETPSSLNEINQQGETNLHNMWNLETPGQILTVSRLFHIFSFAFCLAIPLLKKFSPKAHGLFKKYRIPIVPIGIGALFLTNYIVLLSAFNYLENYPIRVFSAINEMKECNWAFIYVAFGCVEFRQSLLKK